MRLRSAILFALFYAVATLALATLASTKVMPLPATPTLRMVALLLPAITGLVVVTA
jgi:hypothetical protein